MVDVLVDLKEWLQRLIAEKSDRERQGEQPAIEIKLVERAIVEIEEQRAGKVNQSRAARSYKRFASGRPATNVSTMSPMSLGSNNRNGRWSKSDWRRQRNLRRVHKVHFVHEKCRALFDHLVGAGEECWRDREAECFGGS
jgi:hypothetical protein